MLMYRLIWAYKLLTLACFLFHACSLGKEPQYDLQTLTTSNHSEGGALYFFVKASDNHTFYFSDPSANVLRSVDIYRGLPAVSVGTLHEAGDVDGPAQDALLSRPRGICQASDGSLLFLDTGGPSIRRVHNGQVTTVVPKGSHACRDGGSEVATISSGAWDVVCLPDGSMVYSDTECSKLRLVKCVKNCPEAGVGGGALASGLQETVSGEDAPEFMISTLVAGDHTQGGLFYHITRDSVTEPAGRYYYASDAKAHVVRRADTQTGTSEVLFGQPHKPGYQDGAASSSLLHTPRGVCQAPDGSVFVLDSVNQAVRRYKHGVVTTVIGNGSHTRGCVDGGPGQGSISNGAWGLICLPDGSMMYTDPDCSKLRLLKCVTDCPLPETDHKKQARDDWIWWLTGGALGVIVLIAAVALWTTSREFVRASFAAMARKREQHTRPQGSIPTLEDIEAPLLVSFHETDTLLEERGRGTSGPPAGISLISGVAVKGEVSGVAAKRGISGVAANDSVAGQHDLAPDQHSDAPEHDLLARLFEDGAAEAPLENADHPSKGSHPAAPKSTFEELEELMAVADPQPPKQVPASTLPAPPKDQEPDAFQDLVNTAWKTGAPTEDRQG